MDGEQVILHHYPQSPVSEKVRVVLGIKGLAWKSVEIPRLPRLQAGSGETLIRSPLSGFPQ